MKYWQKSEVNKKNHDMVKHHSKYHLSAMLIVATMSIACLWDYDTIEMERQQFPGTLELITGKFLRHSPEFYYWRIKDREAKLKQAPEKIEYYDDIAVAYSKLGADERAIAWMGQKEALAPNLYETYANLGTFYIHSGQLEQGLTYIDKAIEINPNAHFGREIYQKMLVLYILEKKEASGKITLPLNPHYSDKPYPDQEAAGYGFYDFLVDKKMATAIFSHNSQTAVADEGLQKALKGIQGMMRFGNYSSPILLEVLGDLLMQDGDYGAARQLAARAYLQASFQVPDTQSRALYQQKAAAALILQYNEKGGKRLNLEDVKMLFSQETAEADTFFAGIMENEHRWIAAHQDLDEAFGATYYESPSVSKMQQQATGEAKIGTASKSTTDLNIEDYRYLHFKVPVDTAIANLIDAYYDGQEEQKEETILPSIPENEGGGFSPNLLIALGIVVIFTFFIALRLYRYREGT